MSEPHAGYRCRHCGRLVSARTALGASRRLCNRDYRDRAVRSWYPVPTHLRRTRGPDKRPRRVDREPTEAELDALIAERRPTMPAEPACSNNLLRELPPAGWTVPRPRPRYRHNGFPVY